MAEQIEKGLLYHILGICLVAQHLQSDAVCFFDLIRDFDGRIVRLRNILLIHVQKLRIIRFVDSPMLRSFGDVSFRGGGVPVPHFLQMAEEKLRFDLIRAFDGQIVRR